MAASATWDTTFGDAAVEKGAELGFKAGKRCIDELSARNDDDIERGARLVLSEQLANPTLGPIPQDGPAHLSRRRDAKPGRRRVGSPEEHHHVPAADFEAGFVGLLEIGAAPDVLGRAKSQAHALF